METENVPCEVLQTKFGTARIDSKGYYYISSRKEGNGKKLLHRLVWEDVHGESIPADCVIHHKDGNPLNNHSDNLELMTKIEHNRLHNNGRKASEEARRKMSESRKGKPHSDEHNLSLSKSQNSTGYYRVQKHKTSRVTQGFRWVYLYYDETGKRKSIGSTSIDKLEKKVKAKDLPWINFSEMGESL